MLVFYKTRSLTDLLEAAEKNPFDTFETCQLTDVRQYCIKLLRANYVLDINNWHWTFENLRVNMFSCVGQEDPMAGEFLGWCLFCTEEHYVHKILEYAETIARVHPRYCPTITKVVCGYLRERMPNYIEKHDLYDLFVTAFKPLACAHYSISEWYAARRCLERINDAKDVRFINQIHLMLANHKERLSHIDHDEGLAVTHETCTATLQTVVQNLDGAIRPSSYDCAEAQKDMRHVYSARKPNKHPLEEARINAHIFGEGRGVTCEECFRANQSWLKWVGE